MRLQIKIAAFIAVFVWASAFVGIRAGLAGYSPGGLALLRYAIASVCLSLIYFCLPNRSAVSRRDAFMLILVGAFGVGFYNLTLNIGEISVSSGIACFIISQSPIITAIIALIFLREETNLYRLLGFLISIIGIAFISVAQTDGGAKWDVGLVYVALAAFSGSCFSLMQKPFLRKYHPIQTTTYALWGGTLFLLVYLPQLQIDLTQALWRDTAIVIYLGIVPAAIGYAAWGYVLSEVTATQAGSFLYYMPFLATLLGWFYLGEMPMFLALIGGLIAICGVWLVNYSYRTHKSQALINPL